MGTAMKKAKVFEFLSDESGATSIEYALIASIVSVSIIVSLTQISTSLQGVFNSVSAAFGSGSN
ncbi:MAG: Flp family type IVb pilin [Proteobacteria bacterium]|nr:Flp family type IVb pilin [Pseudomonadota bacterium]